MSHESRRRAREIRTMGYTEPTPEGVPILRRMNEGEVILAHAADACARTLFGRPLIELPPPLGMLVIDAARATVQAVTTYKSSSNGQGQSDTEPKGGNGE